MTSRATLASFAIAIGSSVALSGDAPDKAINCADGGGTQYEMNVCAARAAEHQESRLNTLMAELRAKLSKQDVVGLEAVQVEWKALREKDCRWEARLFEGGSVAPSVYEHCVAGLTQSRVARLKIFLCEGTGMTGPCDASKRY